MSPLRILQIFGEPLANGGQESYIMNMYRHVDRERVQFDFYTPFTVDEPALETAIRSLGGQVTAGGYPFGTHNNRCFKRGLAAFLADSDPYAVVHIHSGSTYALAVGAALARKHGAARVIVHSHCGGLNNLRYRVIRLLSRRALLTCPTHHAACSHLAARWKYPAALIREGRYRVLHNAVDTQVFRYDPALRQACRQVLGLTDALIIGHVGRFSDQKNHVFLLDVFAALLRKEPSARLVLVGTGEREETIRRRTEELGLQEQVLLLGLRQDVAALMNAFDVLVLPSLYEGLPMVGVEAAATGLPSVVSTNVTPELPLPDLVTYLPLADGADVWADAVLTAARTPRRDTAEELVRAGYDVRAAARTLQQFYEEMV